jgi:hypothetical protein
VLELEKVKVSVPLLYEQLPVVVKAELKSLFINAPEFEISSLTGNAFSIGLEIVK